MFKRNNLIFAVSAIACFFISTLNYEKAYGVKSPENEGGIILQPSPKVQTAKGKDLMDKSDCKVCHAPDQKLVGPSFLEIATKYKGKPGIAAKLADKVIEGGSGVWGPIPMTPHPQISKKDAELMVSYILTTKK